MSPRSAEEWGAAVSRWFGMLGLVACFMLWVVAQRVEPIFVTTFASLLVVGQGAAAITELRRPPAPPAVGPTNKDSA